MSETTSITVLLFAHAADAVGAAEITLDIAAGSNAGDVLDELCGRYEKLSVMRRSLALALDERYIAADVRVSPGSTLAIIPPVSGG